MSESGKRVRIVTDSTHCLPDEILKHYGVTVVPVGIVIDGAVYRDGVDIDLASILERLLTVKEQPSTAAVNPGDFLDTFTRLSETTDSILCILVSKAMTATQESAYLARRIIQPTAPELKIEIIDSKTSAGALGYIIMEAARAAAEGKDLAGVSAVAREMVNRVVYLSALETLQYLINIGRAPKGMSSIGEYLKVKPIIGMVDDTGWIQVVSRVRGNGKAMEKIAELISDYVEDGKQLHAMVHYANSMEDAERLKKLVAARYDCCDIMVTPFSPVMVCTSGPMTGISFYAEY